MYEPREDSYFLAYVLEEYFKKLKNKNIKFLDMGCGTAIHATIASKFLDNKNIVCCDINEEAIKEARSKGFKAIKSDLFSNIKEKFDVISFNPPYLPRSKYDDNSDVTGGKSGDETIIRFLKEAKNYLNDGGSIFLLFSSLTPQQRIKKFLSKYYKVVNVYRKKLFMETLFIFKIKIT